MDGGASEWSFMHSTAVALANAIPNAQHRTLAGQTHEVSAEALAPVLVAFFSHHLLASFLGQTPSNGVHPKFLDYP
jgi:hypothetical protein